MKENKSSRTAEGIALLRAVEAQKPEGERICYDPLARAFVNGFSFFVTRLVIGSGIYERVSPGILGFIMARERFIDDFLKAELDEGLDQVVILGAGFDTRAYRIPGMGRVSVFEVDHPATQKAKIARLKKVIDPLPAHVKLVPVDLDTRPLTEGLTMSGYNEQARTLFIWQGVTVYLSPESIDSTLAFVVQHSRPGSAIIFDYFYSETLRDTSRPEVMTMHRTSRATGEGYLFGIDRGRADEFLAKRGFQDICNTESEELKRLYFSSRDRRAILPGVAIASARVDRASD